MCLKQEIDRQSLLHTILMKVFDHRLIFPPMESPRRILDCGFGAGYWVIEAADKYPNCQVGTAALCMLA
jgi:tRNA G46 methylase TrmB